MFLVFLFYSWCYSINLQHIYYLSSSSFHNDLPAEQTSEDDDSPHISLMES